MAENSSDSAELAPVSVHVLRPAPPVRAFLLAAVLSVIGAVVAVTASAQGWPGVVLVIGIVIGVLGLALLAAAIASVIRMRVKAELTATGFTFRTPAGVRHGVWSDIVKVTASDSGRRLSFINRDETVQHVFTPLGTEDPEMDELIADLTARLDASRRR